MVNSSQRSGWYLKSVNCYNSLEELFGEQFPHWGSNHGQSPRSERGYYQNAREVGKFGILTLYKNPTSAAG